MTEHTQIVNQTVTIPASIEDAVTTLTGIDALLTAKGWERAAIVAAFVSIDNRPGPKSSVTSDRTPEGFAALGIAGLKSHNTVRRYVKAWETSGEPRPQPGQQVALPNLPWETWVADLTDAGEVQGKKVTDYVTAPRLAEAVKADPSILSKVLAENPEVAAAVAKDPSIVAAVRPDSTVIAEALSDPTVAQKVVDRMDESTKESVSRTVTKARVEDAVARSGGRIPKQEDVNSGASSLDPFLDSIERAAAHASLLDRCKIAVEDYGPVGDPDMARLYWALSMTLQTNIVTPAATDSEVQR